MSRGRRKLKLRDFTRELPSKEDRARFDQAMNAKSDLVTAIVHAVEIDYVIEQSIVACLARQDQNTIEVLCNNNGALSTFYSKIGLAYALGIFDYNMMEYINTVRRIRNAFAHARKDISFATPQVLDELTNVKIPNGDDDDLKKGIELVKKLTNQKMREENIIEEQIALVGRAAYVILCLQIVKELLKHQNEAVKNLFKRFSKSTTTGTGDNSQTTDEPASSSG